MIERIGKRDMTWGVVSMILKVGTGVLLYPFVLSWLTDEATGIWTVFTTVQMLVALLDFGFNDSFARNIGYVFSGVHKLKVNGCETLPEAVDDDHVDWNLMKCVISSMKRYYLIMSAILFLLLATVGSWYMGTLVDKYHGDVSEVWISWAVLVVFMCWNLYSLYYQALLVGRGLIEKNSKIIVVSNLSYLVLAIVFVYLGYGLIAIIGAQFLSIVIMRLLSHKAFYTKEIKMYLGKEKVGRQEMNLVFRTISPNAVKVGLTGLGGIIITRSGTFVGSEYLSLAEMASFGITLQLVIVLSRVSTVVTRVYTPKLFEWRVTNDITKLREVFVKSTVVIVAAYILGWVMIEFLGNWALVTIMHSNTSLITGWVLAVMMLQNFLEVNHTNSADFLLSKNEVPFFKASLISAAVTLVLLIVFVVWLGMGVWGMVLAPTIAQAAYQNWKWPLCVIRELWKD